jgi:hypothetical protein
VPLDHHYKGAGYGFWGGVKCLQNSGSVTYAISKSNCESQL